MKLLRTLTCLATLLLRLTSAEIPADSKAQLQAALFAEEATRDLPAAAAAYEAMLETYASQRALAANALFRLAEVRRKQDRKDDAIKLYQRLLTEFPDTEPQAKLSRENLLALGVKELPAPGAMGAAAAAVPMDPEEEKELNRLKARLEVGSDRLLEDVPSYTEKNSKGQLLASHPPITPLSNAAEKGWKVVVTWLLDHGADPNEQGKHGGYLPLAGAARNGSTAICEILLSHGAKISTADGVLSEAISKNYRETAEWLMKNGCDVNASGGSLICFHKFTSVSPLVAAVLADSEVWVKRLLEAKADPNAQHEFSALHLACYQGKVALVKLLLEAGADVNLPDAMPVDGRNSPDGIGLKGQGWMPLHYAVKEPGILALLLAAKATVDAKDALGVTALHLACHWGQKKSAEALLAAGADVNLRSPDPYPPYRPNDNFNSPSNAKTKPVHFSVLHRVIRGANDPPGGKLEYDVASFVATLLKAGAHVDAKDALGFPPLGLALAERQYAVARLLLDAGADANVTVPWSMYESSPQPATPPLLIALAASGPDFDPTELVGALLKAGAKADALGSPSWSAFDVWAESTHCPFALAEVLIKAGAPVEQATENDYTPLARLLTTEAGMLRDAEKQQPSNTQGQPSLPKSIDRIAARIDFLLAHGADPNRLYKSSSSGDAAAPILKMAAPARRLAITRQRVYPKLVEAPALNLYWPEADKQSLLLTRAKPDATPPALTEVLRHWSESYEDAKHPMHELRTLSLWRKTAAGALEEIPVPLDAQDLPALHWGDVLEVANQAAKDAPNTAGLMEEMYRRLVRKVTIKQGDLSQEMTLRGSLAVYDPSRAEAPLTPISQLVRLLGGLLPEFRVGSVSLQHAGPDGPSAQVSWPTLKDNSSLPEEGDTITLTAETDAPKVVSSRASSITLRVPGKMAGWRMDEVSLPPTLVQFLSEAYAAQEESYLINGQTPEERAAKLDALTAENFRESLASLDLGRPKPLIAWPDWAGIKIHRWDDQGKEIEVAVDLAKAISSMTEATSAEDARKADVALMVGDIVDLPMLDQPGQRWQGLDKETVRFFQKVLNGKINVVDESGKFTEATLQWQPPRYLDTPAGLLAVPAGVMTEGRTRTVLADEVARSFTGNLKYQWLERGGESCEGKNVSVAHVRPGDTLHVGKQGLPSVGGGASGQPASKENPPKPRRKVIMPVNESK